MADVEHTSPDAFFASSERLVAPAAPTDLVLDQWAPLTHKQILGRNTWTGPSWVPSTERRRLDAYRIRAAYLANVARHFATATVEEQAERREYGDAGVLRDRVVSGILGDDVQIVVDGASADLPDAPDLPPRPDPAADGADTIDSRVATARAALWETQATQIVDDWEQAWAAQPALAAWQTWWSTWWDLEQMHTKAVETEADAAGLGDGVYMLAWSSKRLRTIVTSIDPGFYFPVLDGDDDAYPEKVHLAWEFETDEGGRRHEWVRRLTFELVAVGETVASRISVDSTDPYGDYQQIVAADPDLTVLDDGTVARWYPWQDPAAEGAEPSTVECVFTDATWSLDETRNGGLADLRDDRAVYAVNEDGLLAQRLPLGVDFIPVVHVPNTPATRTHYGSSVLDLVAQVLDDISASDTDLQAASALAALPMIALTGGQMGDTIVRAGSVANLPAEGRMDVLDLSKALPELRNLNADLLDRMSVNSRVPGEILGRDTGGVDQLSGVSRLVKLGPFRQLIETLRLTRRPKYALLLKMVARLAMVHQAPGLPEGMPPQAQVVFGSYLPADVAEVVTQVTSLLQAHGISRRTALQMLVDAGVDVGDLAEELARIAAEDASGAKDIADATGSEQLAAEHLGLELPADQPGRVPTTPTIALDAGGGTAGQTQV